MSMEPKPIPDTKTIHNSSPQNLIQNNGKTIHGYPVYEMHTIVTPDVFTPETSALQCSTLSEKHFDKDASGKQKTNIREPQLNSNHLGYLGGVSTSTALFVADATNGAATHQNAGSNITHDVDCFTKTRGKTGNSTNIATASVSEHHQAADYQLNSDNSVFDINQQSSSHTTQGPASHATKCSQQSYGATSSQQKRKRGRPPKQPAITQVQPSDLTNNIQPTGEPSTLATTEGTPPTPMTITSKQDLHEKREVQSGSNKAKRALFQDEPLNEKNQKDQEGVDQKKDDQSASKTSKRPLFEDDPADTKTEKAPLKDSDAEKGRAKAARKNKDD